MALTEVDRQLLLRCVGREPGAWRDFVDRYVGLFIHVIQHTAQARSVHLSSADVEDLCSDIFLEILAQDFALLQRFRGQSSLATYLAVVARRVTVREVTRRRFAEALGHVRASHPHTKRESALSSKAAANPEAERIESRDLVQRMLFGLPEAEADIVRMFHLEGCSYREISEKLSIPENTIGPTLSRVREKLRQSVLISNNL